MFTNCTGTRPDDNCVTQFCSRAFFTTAGGQAAVRAVPVWTRPIEVGQDEIYFILRKNNANETYLFMHEQLRDNRKTATAYDG